tara:strand:+ start:199 stop:552 length:354 start_codon:yes stop_codon:yes gene_type:complete
MKYNSKGENVNWTRVKYNSYRKRTEKKKEFVIRVKRMLGGCIRCGYNKSPHALQFDHLDKSLKKDSISNMVHKGGSIKTLKPEIRKCQLLCANCHAIKTYEEKDFLNKAASQKGYRG